MMDFLDKEDIENLTIDEMLTWLELVEERRMAYYWQIVKMVKENKTTDNDVKRFLDLNKKFILGIMDLTSNVVR